MSKQYKCWLSIRGSKFMDYGYVDNQYLEDLIHSKFVKKVRFYKRGSIFFLSYWYENSYYEKEHILLKIEGEIDGLN